MRGSVRSGMGVLGATLLCACAAHRPPKPVTLTSDVRSDGGATILSGAIFDKTTRSLLDVMKAHIPSMQVMDDQPCPDVYLRGRSTIVSSSNPAIYVDGERASNTCVLDMVNVHDLERVEIYPNGQPHGGYQSSPYGVILIFMRTSD